MLLNKCSSTTDAASIIPASTVCGNCGVVERWLLHSVRHEGILLRLCTSCVLRLHPHSFCPTCFTLYPPSPNPGVSCNSCSSLSHSSCVRISPNSPYICPLCQSPNAPIFLLNDKGGDFIGIGSTGGVDNRFVGLNDEKGIVVCRNDVRILEAASAISCFSMSEAALDAKCEAERRAREAVYTRKRAKQALEHMAVVVAKEKMRRKDMKGVEVAVPRFGGNVVGVLDRRDSFGNGGVGGGGLAGVRALEKNQMVGNLEVSEMNADGVVVREINAGECGEKEGSAGLRLHSNGAIMDEHRDMSLGSSLDVGDSGVQKHEVGIVCEISSNPDQPNESAERNLVTNNGVVLPPATEDQLHVVENGHPEQNNDGLKH